MIDFLSNKTHPFNSVHFLSPVFPVCFSSSPPSYLHPWKTHLFPFFSSRHCDLKKIKTLWFIICLLKTYHSYLSHHFFDPVNNQYRENNQSPIVTYLINTSYMISQPSKLYMWDNLLLVIIVSYGWTLLSIDYLCSHKHKQQK